MPNNYIAKIKRGDEVRKGINQRMHESFGRMGLLYFASCRERGCTEYHGKSPSERMAFHWGVEKYEPQARIQVSKKPEPREEIESLGLQISALLIEKGNPHQRVEITQEGVKIVSDDSFAPIERR